MKSPSFLGWYRMLRAHHQWTVFEAIRYALSRSLEDDVVKVHRGYASRLNWARVGEFAN